MCWYKFRVIMESVWSLWCLPWLVRVFSDDDVQGFSFSHQGTFKALLDSGWQVVKVQKKVNSQCLIFRNCNRKSGEKIPGFFLSLRLRLIEPKHKGLLDISLNMKTKLVEEVAPPTHFVFSLIFASTRASRLQKVHLSSLIVVMCDSKKWLIHLNDFVNWYFSHPHTLNKH